MAKMMLTTIDNPFDPFKQFDEWYAFDHRKGYNCCEYLARVATFSDDVSEEDQDVSIEDAIREIIEINPNGMYTIALDESADDADTSNEELIE